MGFDPREWWEKWHPDKAPGKGRPKNTGGKSGTGKAPTPAPNPNARKRRKFTGALIPLTVLALAGCEPQQEQPRTGFTAEVVVRPNATCSPRGATGTAADGTAMRCTGMRRPVWRMAVRDR